MIIVTIHIVISLEIIDNLWALVGLDPTTQSTDSRIINPFYSYLEAKESEATWVAVVAAVSRVFGRRV